MMMYDNAHKIFLKYGAQGVAADFAYTDKKYYTKRTPQQHAGIFAVGAAGGIMQGVAEKSKLPFGTTDKLKRQANFALLSSIGYAGEYFGMSHVKANYQGLYHSGWHTKVGVSGYKVLAYTLMLK